MICAGGSKVSRSSFRKTVPEAKDPRRGDENRYRAALSVAKTGTCAMTPRTDKISAYDAAIDYLQRGWKVMKLPPRSKEPYKRRSFASNTITWDNVGTLARANNISVIFSTTGELKDLDCDFKSAADLAHGVGMEGASFGRPSGGFGHYLFNASGCEAKQFELPESDEYPRPLPSHNGKPSRLVLEIRGNDNTYTMFPPSVMPAVRPLLGTVRDVNRLLLRPLSCACEPDVTRFARQSFISTQKMLRRDTTCAWR